MTEFELIRAFATAKRGQREDIAKQLGLKAADVATRRGSSGNSWRRRPGASWGIWSGRCPRRNSNPSARHRPFRAVDDAAFTGGSGHQQRGG